MKIKLQAITILFLLSNLLIAACEPGGTIVPTTIPTLTFTSTPTFTPVPTNTLTPTITPSPTFTPIPTETPTIDPKNYRVIHVFMRWTKARDYCASLKGHLVTIGSKAEDDFVYHLNPNSWLGLSDDIQEGKWQWVTGEPLIYINWAQDGGEPDNCAHGCGGHPAYYEEEDYAHFGEPYWNDWGDVESTFVCEWEPAK